MAERNESVSAGEEMTDGASKLRESLDSLRHDPEIGNDIQELQSWKPDALTRVVQRFVNDALALFAGQVAEICAIALCSECAKGNVPVLVTYSWWHKQSGLECGASAIRSLALVPNPNAIAEHDAALLQKWQTELLHELFPEGGFEGDYMDMTAMCEKACIVAEEYGKHILRYQTNNELAALKAQIASAEANARVEELRALRHIVGNVDRWDCATAVIEECDRRIAELEPQGKAKSELDADEWDAEWSRALAERQQAEAKEES